MRNLAPFAQHLTTNMSSLPNLREYDDLNLAESPSDSEELMVLKFKERMQRKWEQRERKEREERDTRKRRSREERERSAREEVRRGKVSAG